MKTSVKTGEEIYQVLKEKMDEIDRLKEEFYTVKDEIGEDSVAFEIVGKVLTEKKNELEQLEKQTYTIYKQPIPCLD